MLGRSRVAVQLFCSQRLVPGAIGMAVGPIPAEQIAPNDFDMVVDGPPAFVLTEPDKG